MNKTLLLKGITPLTGEADALNITEKVLDVSPTLETPTITSQFFSTLATEIVEGKAKYLLNRKSHINRYNTTQAIHEEGSVGDATLGDLTTSNFKLSQKEAFEFDLNKSWDAGFIYDKKKDPLVREGQLMNDMASVLEDKREQEASDFYSALNDDIASTNNGKSNTYAQYTSSINGQVVDSPDINKTIGFSTSTTDQQKAKLLIDAIWKDIEDIAKMGRAGSDHAGYPYARGTRDKLGLKIIVKADLVLLISNDERFVQASLAPQMVQTGMVGVINNVPVVRDDMLDTISNFDYMILATGKYSPVIVAQEMADSIQLFDHPTKPTRAQLTEASGGWDVHVTPYINFVRTGIVQTTSPATRKNK